MTLVESPRVGAPRAGAREKSNPLNPGAEATSRASPVVARTAANPDVHDSVLAQLAALKTAPTAALKAKWRELFETEPPPYNRRFLESRLAYRIQELVYGGLKPETLARLRVLGEQLDGGCADVRKRRVDQDRPIAGTRLIREWQSIEYTVTVRQDDYEYQGRPYKSLSAIARTITGTRWNGLVFFGLKNQRSRT